MQGRSRKQTKVGNSLENNAESAGKDKSSNQVKVNQMSRVEVEGRGKVQRDSWSYTSGRSFI